MFSKIKILAAFALVLGLAACAEADIDPGNNPELSGSVSTDAGAEGGKQPTILPGPDHQEGVPTDEAQDDGVPAGNDVLPPVTPDAFGFVPKAKNPN